MAEVSETPSKGIKEDIQVLREFVELAESDPEIGSYDNLSSRFTASVADALAGYIKSRNQLEGLEADKRFVIVQGSL